MLKKKNRLKKRKEIENLLKNGRKIVGNLVVIFYLPNNLEYSRFAFSVSKKISKKAVVRNKIRRRLREIVRREILPKMEKNFDCLIMAKKSILESDYHKIKRELEQIFGKFETRRKVLP